jgi:ferredoxin/flavodoxin---NADP+ reductase
LPGKRLYLLGTGTGLAPFMSIAQDPEVYEQFEKVVLVHGCRQIDELAYQERICKELPNNEWFGDQVSSKLVYFPTVTREPYRNQGRIPDLIDSGRLFDALGLPPLSAEHDRFMLCGSPAMLKDTQAVLEKNGLAEGNMSHQGHYLIERAFVEK